MIKTNRVISCDICGNEVTMDIHDDFINYGWNRIFRNGRDYDLCPEHSVIYFKITSDFDEKLNNFFEGEVAVNGQ